MKPESKNIVVYSAAICLLCYLISACSPSIRSFTVKASETNIYIEIECVSFDKDGKLVKDDPPSPEDERIINSSVKAICDKYNAVCKWSYSYDSLAIIWKLYVPDINDLNALLYDFNTRENRIDKIPLDLKVRTTVDSVYLTLHATGVVFIKNSFISIKTPTEQSFFRPISNVKYATPFLAAPNKMEYYFHPVSDSSALEVYCGFKKSATIKIDTTNNYFMKTNTQSDSLKRNEPNNDEINLFGFRQNYWEFWCIIIGGIASIATIIAIFRKK